MLFTYFLKTDIFTDTGFHLKLNAKLFDYLDFLIKNIFAAYLTRHRITQSTSSLFMIVKNCTAYPFLHKIISCRQTSRSRTDYRTAFLKPRFAFRNIWRTAFKIDIRNITLQKANRNCLVILPSPAGILTRPRTYPAKYRRQSDIFFDRPYRIGKFPSRDLTYHQRNIHLRRTTNMTGPHAVTDMIAQKQFQSRFSHFGNLRGLTFHFHSIDRQSRTRRDHPRCTLKLDYANHTAGRRITPLKKAHRRNIDTDLFSSIEYRRPFFDCNYLIVYFKFYHYSTLMAFSGHIFLQASQRKHFSSSISCFSYGVIAIASAGHCCPHNVQPIHSSVTE